MFKISLFIYLHNSFEFLDGAGTPWLPRSWCRCYNNSILSGRFH